MNFVVEEFKYLITTDKLSGKPESTYALNINIIKIHYPIPYNSSPAGDSWRVLG
jgi:hypothetical protein